jgi:hypothetical protein
MYVPQIVCSTINRFYNFLQFDNFVFGNLSFCFETYR